MPDTAREVAFNSAAPADERYDAQAELTKAAMPKHASDLPMQPADLVPFLQFVQQSHEEAAMEKAMQFNNIVPFPSLAARNRLPGMQSVSLDDTQGSQSGDYYEKPGVFSFDSLRQMVNQTPILNAVIMTRQRQVKRFCKPQQNGRGPGFKIALKDATAKASEEQLTQMLDIQKFFLNSGDEAKPRQRMRLKRDDYSAFVSKLVRETLTLDSMPIETEWKRARGMGLSGLYAVDGTTIRLCTENGYRGDDEIYALQLVQGQIRSLYGYDDLIYVPRNPVADVLAGGYGMSETELLVRVVTGFLNAFTYNTKFFDSNAIPKGMLHLHGNFDEKDLNAFRRQWNAMVKGVNNAWQLPVMISKDTESKASFENFGADVNEMMFGKWISFLASLICAIYGMAPDEINFESFTTGGRGLGGDDTEEKLVNSKDKGLRPLLDYLAGIQTDYIVSEFNEDFCLAYTGLDEEKPETTLERQKLSMTWNEFRALDDLDPIDGPMGDMPINPALISAWQMENQQPAEDFGQPGGEQPGGDPDDGDGFGGDGDPEDDDDDAGGGPGDDGGDGFGEDDDTPDDLQKTFGLPVVRIEP